MNILLFNPPAQMLKQEGFGIVPPLGILYIGAVLEKNKHKVKIVDCVAHNWKRPIKLIKEGETVYVFDLKRGYLKDLLENFHPDFVGISNLFATTENTCIELAKKIKSHNKKIKIVVGGTNATARVNFFLKQDCVDYVIRGEGEYALRDLVNCVEKNKNYAQISGLCFKKGNEFYLNQNFAWINNLDALPFPAYHLLDNNIENYFLGNFTSFSVKKRILTLTTSRGCVRNCIFCSGMKHLGHWRARSPENVLAELLYLKNNFKIEEIAFVDANINLKKDRFIAIMNLMKEHNLKLRWTPFGGIYVQTFTPDLIKLMKKTGCHSINFAIEHGDPKMQKYIGKIVPLEKIKTLVYECKQNGIWSHGYFVVGLPPETKKSLCQCLYYAKEANFDSISFFIGTPLPGSRFYEEIAQKKQLKSENLRFISKNIWWTEMDPSHLTKTIKSFMAEYAKFKFKNEIKPKNLFFRLKNLNHDNIKLYLKVIDRFIKNLFVR